MMLGNAKTAMQKMVRQKRTFSDVLAFMDVERFDEMFKRWTGYIGPGEEVVAGKRKQFERFEECHKATYAPTAVITGHAGQEKIRFIDGRHRYAVLRDAGLKVVKIAVPKSNVKPLAKWGVLIGVIREPKQEKDNGIHRHTDKPGGNQPVDRV